MLRELGYLLLVFCFLTSSYGSLSGLLSSISKQKALLLSSRVASLYSFILAFLASAVLSYSFFNADFSILYVYKNSSNDLPAFYRLSALWSSLEGSHLLWTLLLSFCVSFSLWIFKKENEFFLPLVSFLAQGILSWMFFLCISSSNPFEPVFPIPGNGLGMNELLQNPYMAIHPPCLFLGYTALCIPFCYSFSSLWLGALTESCAKTMRRWALFSWIFLTVGIFLGGRWAYVELGWGGYWAWDPVENSSFLPWLFLTAFLHSLLILRQFGQQKKLLFVFSFLSFFFCFFGTFLTRSGMVSSVHSFAQSDVAMSYLIFLGFLFALFVITYSFRGHKKIAYGKSRFPSLYHIDFLILGQILFVSFAVIILMGTLYPMLSEYVTGVRFSVQAPYFNSFAPYIGFSFIVLMTFGNLYKRKIKLGSIKLKSSLFISFSSILLTVSFCYFSGVFDTEHYYPFVLQFVGILLCFLSLVLFLYDFYLKLKFSRFSIFSFLRLNLGSVGALICHIGLLIAILGFLGNYRGLNKLITLQKAEGFKFYGYDFNFKKLNVRQVENVLLFEAAIDLFQEGHLLASIFPARAKYPTKDELIHEVDYLSNFWHDIYVTLVDYDQETGLWATLEFQINPTIRFVWLSVFLFAIGGFLSLLSTVPLRRLKG